MRFPFGKVHDLLTRRFDQIEEIWDRNPYDEVSVFALTIKEFMLDHQITLVDEGMMRFIEFKQEQTRSLSDVGLGAAGELSQELPHLATQLA